MTVEQLVFRAQARASGALQMGAVGPAQVTRLALQNAGSIASLVLTMDRRIANAPQPRPAGAADMAPAGPDFQPMQA